jgi:uncharacterized membrane protein
MFTIVREYLKLVLMPDFLPGHAAAFEWLCWLAGIVFLLFLVFLAFASIALVLHRVFHVSATRSIGTSIGLLLYLLIAVCLFP